MKPFLTFLTLASLLLLGCKPEGQDIAFEVNVTQWASPNLPEVGATVVLEEQRLTNGVLNSFFTEIERVTTPESGVVELQTVRSNVLALRIRVEQINCFDEIVDLNPEDVVIDGTPNVVDVWEGVVTLLAFPALVWVAYMADVAGAAGPRIAFFFSGDRDYISKAHGISRDR